MLPFGFRRRRCSTVPDETVIAALGLLLAALSVVRTFVVLPFDPFVRSLRALLIGAIGGLLVLLLVGMLMRASRAVNGLARSSARARSVRLLHRVDADSVRALFLIGILVVAALALVQDSLIHDDRLLALPGLRRDGELILWGVGALLATCALRVEPGAARSTSVETAVLVAVLGVVGMIGWHHMAGGEGPRRAATVAIPLLALHRLRDLGHQRVTRVVLAVLVPLLAISLVLALDGVRVVSVGEHRLLPGLEEFRPRGVFSWPIKYGTAAGLAVIASLQGLHRRTLHPALAGVTVVIGIASILLADAMTAAFALVAALLVAGLTRVLLRDRSRPLSSPVVALVAGSGALGVLLFPFAVARFGSAGSFTGRGHLWRRVLDEVRQREFLIGFGDRPLMNQPGLFDRLDASWGARQAHNTGLELWLTGGVIGAVLFAALVAALIVLALRRAEATRGWSTALVTFVLIVWSTENYVAWLAWTDRLLLLVTFALVLSWGVERDIGGRSVSVVQNGDRSG